jgi:hypothetical protein
MSGSTADIGAKAIVQTIVGTLTLNVTMAAIIYREDPPIPGVPVVPVPGTRLALQGITGYRPVVTPEHGTTDVVGGYHSTIVGNPIKGGVRS